MDRLRQYIRLPKVQRRLAAVVLAGYVFLLANSLLLWVFDQSTALVYMSIVWVHVALGTLLVVPALGFLVLHLRKATAYLRHAFGQAGLVTVVSLALLLASGFGLIGLGASYADGWLLGLHIGTAGTAILGFAAHVAIQRGAHVRLSRWRAQWKEQGARVLHHPLTLIFAAFLAVSLLFAGVSWMKMRGGVFVSGDGESQLEPAGAVLAHQGFLNDDDLTRSETCGQVGCHPDVYQQWSESVHHFSSFNNPYYKKTVEAMVARHGNDAARWCASCHDPVPLFAGRIEDGEPINMEHKTAEAGVTCLSCHAIEGLRNVKGNGRYVISNPDEYPFARADDPSRQWLHNALLRAKPEPHRQAMLKPVHRTAEFCGTCHKVSVPPEVNHYRWKRGQDQYDSWHSSGVSGNTVRSFYVPDQPKTCTSCHMPHVPSDDQGNDGGYIRSHRFAAANTTVPYLKGHTDQVHAAQQTLQDSIAAVDLFSVTVNGQTYGPNDAMPALRPGDELAVEAVVRNLGVGHRLPAGTNDSNELWFQLLAKNEAGSNVLASGQLNAKRQVDSTAHVWGAVLVDRASQAIDKRNIQDWVATVYANTISPGTASAVHYRFEVPADATPITELSAALKYRKFKWYYNHWTFRGHVPPGQPDSLTRPTLDLRTWKLDDSQAPRQPITTMAEDQRQAGQAPEATRPRWERWNDYGIGLLLNGEKEAALQAFEQVATLAPRSPEGPINRARVFISEGQLDRAVDALDEAERRRPGYLKTAYFRGQVHKANARYDEALSAWQRVYEAYPQDRVLLTGIGRVHYLLGNYKKALTWFGRVLQINPEHLGALYNRMIILAALGQEEAAAQAREKYEYHKIDEKAKAVASEYKQRHPMANREAQPIHEHGLHPADERGDWPAGPRRQGTTPSAYVSGTE